MADAQPLSKAEALRYQVRDARELYFRLSAQLDELNLEVRAQTHGMVQPDGTQAIHNLANQKRAAFEQYQRALSALTADVVGDRPRVKPGKQSAKTAIWPQLTPREVEVLDRIATGMTSKEIARDLNISFKTAVTHRTHLMSKFDVSNVALLIRRAISAGHIKP